MNKKWKSLSLTTGHIQVLESTLQSVLAKPWSLSSPVFLFDRCWLRLEKIRIDQLKKRLPPDNSGEAPELTTYFQLLQNGYDHLMAAQECWAEFGIDEFYRAIRNYWYWQDKGNNDWTFSSYVSLINQYRNSFNNSSVQIPLIILSRQKSQEKHFIKWVGKTTSRNSTEIAFMP